MLVQFVWSQWSALGVAGHGSTEQRMVDPEALLLLSTVVARHDPRLFDEILDWLHTNGSWINLSRLARIQKESTIGEDTVLAAIGELLGRHSEHRKWLAATKGVEAPADASRTRPLFVDVPELGDPDPHFAKWGWRRELFTARGLSRPVSPGEAGAFLIKLRALFGRQSRAEILAWLVAHKSGHPAQIARDVCYFRRSVQQVLNEVAVSGHAFGVTVGRKKHFAVSHDEWRFLLATHRKDDDPQFPRWVPWVPLFRTLRLLHDFLNEPDVNSMSANAQAIGLRRAIDRSGLTAGGLTGAFAQTEAGGANALETAVDEASELLRTVGTPSV